MELEKDNCKECYRRERRRLGLCLVCDRPVVLNAARRPAAHCADHLVVTARKPKKLPPVKKHVLTLEKFRTVKRMLAAESPVSLKLIARTVGVSERTIRRAAKGEYDNYFKGAALRNAVDLRQVNSE